MSYPDKLKEGEPPPTSFYREKNTHMFNSNSLESILTSFTKVQTRLETFAKTEETKAETLAEQQRIAREKEELARLNAETARRVSTNIVNLLSA